MPEVLAGGSVLLLLGGLAIGGLSGQAGLERAGPFFVDPFQVGIPVYFAVAWWMHAGGVG